MTGLRTLRTICAAAALVVAAPALAHAQDSGPGAAPGFQLTVANIMRGPELVGTPPEDITWTDNGRWVYFEWKPGGEPWHKEPSLWRVRVPGGEPERLSEEEADSVRVLLAEGDISADEERRVIEYRGDLYVIDRGSLAVERLTRTEAEEDDPVFGARGEVVYFVRDGNVFSLALDDGALRQLTDLRSGTAPKEEPDSAASFLERQQKRLFESVRRELEEQREREQEREEREQRGPEVVYLGEGDEVRRLAVEPRGRWAVVRVGDAADDDRETIVPDYVTASGYTETIEARAKVGDDQATTRVGLVDLSTGAVEWLDLVPDADAAREPEQDSIAFVRVIGWSPDGTRALLNVISYDYKDRWLEVIDARTGEVRVLARDHSDAWLGGPCSPWETPACAGWMPEGERVYFTSERDGWEHLYVVDADGGEPRQLTSGEWEIKQVDLAPSGERFYLTTSELSPFEQHFYWMDVDGGERVRITRRTGRHDVVPSPNGERLAVVHSYSNRPPELYLMQNEPGAEMRRVTHSPTEAWLSYDWIAPEIIWFEARDGTRVPARIYRPEDVGAEPNGAAVIFVHGAGYLHNVHRWWSHYYREYMFHHLLAERGFTVLDIDYRGSAGYGREWRTAIYRHMGGKDLTDQVDGARWLVEHEGIDPERIGIYGGSYGGFLTLMALFKHPETFAAGAALRAVTDWAHYNHWYTSRILNLPQRDTVAYRRSSPIYYAEGLEDPLLIAHGMVDTNVHFQDVVRLVERLIQLGKTDWELAVYPSEGHGFEDPDAWTDEYRRILELFTRHLTEPSTLEDR